MGKILLLGLLCASAFTRAQVRVEPSTSLVYAQPFTKRTWLMGLQAGYSKGIFLGPNLTTHLYGGYFITNQLLVGISSTASQEGFKAVREVSYSIGPLVRYQFTRTRFSPFLMASLQLGQSTASGSESQTITYTSGPYMGSTSSWTIQGTGIPERTYCRSLGAGLSMRLTHSLRVDLSLNWQDQANTPEHALRFDAGLYQAQLGLNFLFGNKHAESD